MRGRTLSLGALHRHVVIEATLQQRSAEPCPDPRAPCPEPPRALVLRTLEARADQLVMDEHAARSSVGIDPAEIEQVIDSVARRATISKEAVLEEARRYGLEAEEYRQRIGEALLARKSWKLGPGRDPLPGLGTEAEKRATLLAGYEEWKKDPRNRYVHLRFLAFPILDHEAYVTESLTSLKERAAKGEDFCTMIARYTQTQCAAMPALPVGYFSAEIQRAIEVMKPMELHGPLRFGDAMALLQITDRPAPPALEHVEREVWERAATRLEEQAMAAWRWELRAKYGVQVGQLDTASLERDVVEVRRTTPADRSGDPRILLRELARESFRDGR